MNCLPCLRGKNPEGKKSDGENSENKEDAELLPVAQPKDNQISKQPSVNNEDIEKQDDDGAAPAGSASTFKFEELASATKNFKQECLLGESGFGKVYKGTLADGKVVAVKQLDTQRTKGNKEFIKEVIKLSELHHPNLVELFGYCADGDHRLLVYEYMQMGSIKDHLHDLPPGKKPLDWITRMKAAAGAAKAIDYLHEKINPPVLCRNIKSTNVLLDENFKPKVGDYGLVNLESSSGGSEQKRVMGTVGELTLKSDVYSFGVIILELITGRKALDTSRPTEEQDLVSWAQQYFKDPQRFHELADPMFKGVVPENILNQAVGVASRCLQEESGVRPLISEIVGALNFLKVAPSEGFLESSTSPTSAPPKKYPSSSSSSSSSSSDSEHELDFKIEPFNRPEPQSEPQPQSQPESAHESEQEHEWESDPETEPEPEPEPDLDTDSDSESESDTESEPEPVEVFKPEAVFEPEVSTSHKDQTDSDSESEAEQVAKPEPVVEPEASTSYKDQPDSDHDSSSTSGSIYDEDAYSEEDFSDEDKPNTSILIKSRSKARMKTKVSKKKVMFKTEETDSIKPSMQRVSTDDDQSISNSNNQPIKRKNTSRMRKSDSRRDDNSDIESTDGSDDEFEPQRFKSTISRFNAESRCYSSYQDETVLTSSSDNEK